MSKVTRGNMRNVLDFELDIRVLHVGPSTDKDDMEKFTGRKVIAVPEEGAFFIKDLGVPVMRWNYVIMMGSMIHVATEEELKHTIPYIVYQFKKQPGYLMKDDEAFMIPKGEAEIDVDESAYEAQQEDPNFRGTPAEEKGFKVITSDADGLIME